MGSFTIEIILILILILANGFFSASEIAIVSARKGRLEQQAKQGVHGARSALNLADSPSRFLAAVQIGITLVGTLASAFGGARLADALAGIVATVPVLNPYAEPLALALVVLLISYFTLILGELVPKQLALQRAEAIASAVAPFMTWLSRLAAPIISFLTFSNDLVLRLLGRADAIDESVTEDDVLAMVRAGTEGGSLEHAEESLITSVFTFTEKSVRDVMTPRTEVVAINLHTSRDAALRLLAESGHSRVPVFDGSLDNVVGVLHARDMLHFALKPVGANQPSETSLRPLLRPPVVVVEAQRAVAAFQQLKQDHAHLAMVLDEYGQIAGLVTLEDFLEELVGEIHDEYDEASQPVLRRDDGSYLVDGLLSFAEAQRLLALPPLTPDLNAVSFTTVAGFVLALLGHLPKTGDKPTWQGYRIEVVDMDGMRVDKVLITPPETRRQ